jgi:hypothetical protein
MSKFTQEQIDSFEEIEPDYPCELDVWVRIPDELMDPYGGNCIRKRWKTFKEVYEMLHKYMNYAVCDKCGKEVCWEDWQEVEDCRCCPTGADWEPYIGEYDSGKSNYDKDYEKPIAEKGERLIQMMAYCCEGSNEGYQAHLAVTFAKDGGGFGCKEQKFVHLYWIKSFQGMEHCHELVKRLNIATGNWHVTGEDRKKYRLE